MNATSRRPTVIAALTICAFAGSTSSVNAFVVPRPSTVDIVVPAFATLEDTTAEESSSSPLETDATAAELNENPRNSGLALMLDDGEVYYFPDDKGSGDFYHQQCSLYDNEHRVVEVSPETLYFGNVVVNTPLPRRSRKKRRGVRSAIARGWMAVCKHIQDNTSEEYKNIHRLV
mmetsp:Transcript_11043/g.22553  ORF Transcript_11043/g.22553 Transcript_11043/m.22553 type:complete len:174 (-) Transcript_11043:525-1046(-)